MNSLSANASSLFVRIDGKDYAIAHFGKETETMDLMFKNSHPGTFTLSVVANGTNFSYLHLVDHITGKDIDLLQQPSYSFQATGDESEARFKLVFKVSHGR